MLVSQLLVFGEGLTNVGNNGEIKTKTKTMTKTKQKKKEKKKQKNKIDDTYYRVKSKAPLG